MNDSGPGDGLEMEHRRRALSEEIKTNHRNIEKQKLPVKKLQSLRKVAEKIDIIMLQRKDEPEALVKEIIGKILYAKAFDHIDEKAIEELRSYIDTSFGW